MAKKKRATKSRVMIDLPKRPLAYADAIFTINAKGERLGEIRISQGGLDWYSRNARNPKKFGWTKLAKLLEGE
jgi:hypothetical protein